MRINYSQTNGQGRISMFRKSNMSGGGHSRRTSKVFDSSLTACSRPESFIVKGRCACVCVCVCWRESKLSHLQGLQQHAQNTFACSLEVNNIEIKNTIIQHAVRVFQSRFSCRPSCVVVFEADVASNSLPQKSVSPCLSRSA